MSLNRTERMNAQILWMMSRYLNEAPDFIRPAEVRELSQSCGLSPQEAFSLLLAASCGLNIDEQPQDRELYQRYFPQMVHCLNAADYEGNAYYRAVRLPRTRSGKCELRQERYKPCEAFVCDDILQMPDGRTIPQIGFFDAGFTYPALLEDGRIWMSVTPNEIRTMEAPLCAARGRVLTYGLGMGYFAYMASRKAAVSSITVVEQNADVVALFQQYILPQFEHADKVRVVQGDAFAFAARRTPGDGFDFVFADLWHDVGDGLAMYKRLKRLEDRNPDSDYAYWIERSMQCYL